MSTIRHSCKRFAGTRALAIGSSLVLAAALLGPVAAALFPAVAVPIYHSFGVFCHQNQGRCWELWAQPFPVCVRCFGVYAGIFAAAILRLPFGRKTFLTATVVMAASWALEFFGLAHFPEGIRFLCGAAWGLTAASALSPQRKPDALAQYPGGSGVAKPGGPQANWSNSCNEAARQPST